MGPQLTVAELLEAARHLAPEERALLASALARESPGPGHEITELRGLGKDVWNNIDAQEYVDSERDSWGS